MDKLKIGNISFKNNLFLAPMLDVTNMPYRLICRKNGAAMAYIEMITSEELFHTKDNANKKTITNKEDKPLGIQITARDVKDIKKILPMLEKGYEKEFNLIDLNCGCPADKTFKQGFGCFLLNFPEKIKKIIFLLKDNGFTTTAKIRLGFKSNNVLKVSKLIEKAGADAITIHSRLANQDYSVPADWNQIKKVKKQISIPIIGNGDIFSGKDAEKMLEIADFAMIGRAAIGNPLIFDEILYYLRTGKEKEFNFKQNLRQFKEYLSFSQKYNLFDMKKTKFLGVNFIKNIDGASKLRQEFMLLKNQDEINSFITKLLKKSTD